MWALVLTLIWFVLKPGGPKKIETRVDDAIALTAECKFDEARAELGELKSTAATSAQLARIQKAIDLAVPACEKKRQRAKAWSEASSAIGTALQSSNFEAAQTRLNVYTRRWGSDADASEAEGRIDAGLGAQLLDQAESCLKSGDHVCTQQKSAAAERLRRPELESRIAAVRAAQALASAQAQNAAQSAHNLVLEANHEMAITNYKGAIDKMEICATMVDAGNAECAALKAKAERLQKEMARCVANGSDWVSDRCQ